MKAEDLLSAMSEIDERFTDESSAFAPGSAVPATGRENGRIIIESRETALLLPADQWVVIGRGHHCLTIRKRRVEQ